MGQEQSANGAQLKSRRDEDIPYTSYSISKPIDAETPKSSPRLPGKLKRSPVPTRDSQNEAGTSSQAGNIVTVAEGAAQELPTEELVKLESIPTFTPILRQTINTGSGQELETLDSLDASQLLELCQRYKEHLRQCSEAVAFDQNALCVRIKEINYNIQSIYNNLTERQKTFAKYAEQVHRVSEMQTVLNKVKMNVEQTVPLMERLNSVLPEEHQLEPFSMKPK